MTRNANSATYWLPRIEAAGLPTPRTIMVPYDHHAALLGLYGEGDGKLPVAEVAQAADKIGPVVFIRGDQTSAKHTGREAYRLEGRDPARIAHMLALNVEDAECRLGMAEGCQEAFLVREWLDLEGDLFAFGYGLAGDPHLIAREFRFFADPQGAICFHPYWPADAITDNTKDPNWAEKLHKTQRPLSDSEMAKLSWMATLAAVACPAAKSWSVDFACDKAGKWWLVDMAVAAASYHAPECPMRGDSRISGPRAPEVPE